MAKNLSLPQPFQLAHSITNIKSLIHEILDIKNPNYQKWSHFFQITVGCLALTDFLLGHDHVDHISPSEWSRADFLLQSWIYSTISDDL